MRRKNAWSAVLAVVLVTAVTPAAPAQAASQLVVDLAAQTGALRYGATGFLYGLGDEGIPNETMLAALKPQVTAQKAPDGLQHPNGDALKVAPMFKRAGGRDIQIYMQDVYKQWPYENLGINDYLAKVDTMVRKVVADPYRTSYVYVPFNEPDQIWYGGNLTGFMNDYRTVYRRIRSIDPGARIAGPNFASYRSADLRTFLQFARDNSVLPDVTTWHELGNDFFTSWNAHYSDYRAIESSLGISPRSITINEYGRSSGDLGVPGNLVQFVAKFENSKVDGCLAYWTTAGGLNDLVTRNNQATGGWWLYKWYGELTGGTVAVTPPAAGGSLQGLAAFDQAKKQARVIFGGNNPASGTYDTNLVVKGIPSTLGTPVHATVWGVDDTGLNPSPGPYKVTEADFTPASGQVTIPLTGLKGSSAYHVVVTPAKGATSGSRYEAEFADLSGSITYGQVSSVDGSTRFVVTAPTDGYYNVGLRYSAPASRTVRLRLNGSDLTDVTLPATTGWNTVTAKVFLTAGINRLEVGAAQLDYIDVASSSGTITAYEAESGANTLGGAARVSSNSAASGGGYIGYIGAGAANTLRFNNVTVPSAGRYRMVVTYANGELGEGASNYNTNIVDRYADISVNGGSTVRHYFRNTLGWSNYRTTVVDVTLAAGANTITFGNASTRYAPDVDRIQIAAPLG
ncbi:CBM35 domain-containing protein [Nonomuraea sp. NPDC049695]|uniref:CBM35 domain-containing protein n=1 Tax=Nonomuraea sp. NPDC049695 TaxID=3154734 RepID=UPI003416C658